MDFNFENVDRAHLARVLSGEVKGDLVTKGAVSDLIRAMIMENTDLPLKPEVKRWVEQTLFDLMRRVNKLEAHEAV